MPRLRRSSLETETFSDSGRQSPGIFAPHLISCQVGTGFSPRPNLEWAAPDTSNRSLISDA